MPTAYGALRSTATKMKFSAPVIANNVQINGTSARSLQLTITYRSTGWNKYFRGGGGAPQYIYDDAGDIVRYFPTADFGVIVL